MTHDDSSRVLISVARWCKAGIVLERGQQRERKRRGLLATDLVCCFVLVSICVGTIFHYIY
jgi:hypothetical protein